MKLYRNYYSLFYSLVYSFILYDSNSVCPSSPEELIAVNKIWHKSCFVCGGTNDKETEGGGHGCKKTLTLQNYLTHDNQPYCLKCHSLVNTIKASSSSSTK